MLASGVLLWIHSADLSACMSAKRGQDKQIRRMENQTNKKFRTFDVGENFLLPVSEFDKRSPFDYRNLGFVKLRRTEDGLYQIGNPPERLSHSYSCN